MTIKPGFLQKELCVSLFIRERIKFFKYAFWHFHPPPPPTPPISLVQWAGTAMHWYSQRHSEGAEYQKSHQRGSCLITHLE